MSNGQPPVVAVVPVKPFSLAKTRTGWPLDERRRLGRQLMSHTVSVLLAADCVDHVVVVTTDPDVSAAARELGADVLGEGDRPRGLNGAVTLGIRAVRSTMPTADVAVVVADLPQLDVEDVQTVVRGCRAEPGPAFVVDHHGVGTTMIWVPAGAEIVPRFGHRSAEAHARAGLTAVQSPLPGLRLDLDHRVQAEALRALGPLAYNHMHE